MLSGNQRRRVEILRARDGWGHAEISPWIRSVASPAQKKNSCSAGFPLQRSSTAARISGDICGRFQDIGALTAGGIYGLGGDRRWRCQRDG
jgi:hypothetical protein